MVRKRLTDNQWKRISPLLPGKPSDPGRSGINNRQALEGILYIVRTGLPWRDLPSRFGKWGTVYQRFRRWAIAGVFDRIFSATRGKLDLRTIQVDGTIVKVHQHAAGAPKADAHPLNLNGVKQSVEAEVG